MKITIDRPKVKLLITCPHCSGKVMEDIVSSKHVDLHCIMCAKRWFIPLQKYRAFLAKKERAIRERTDS